MAQAVRLERLANVRKEEYFSGCGRQSVIERGCLAATRRDDQSDAPVGKLESGIFGFVGRSVRNHDNIQEFPGVIQFQKNPEFPAQQRGAVVDRHHHRNGSGKTLILGWRAFAGTQP